jgi:TrmH family RNA methyltransferase
MSARGAGGDASRSGVERGLVADAVPVRVRDNRFQRVLALRDNRTKRRRYGQVFVEGMRPLRLLTGSPWEIDSFWFSEARPLPSWAVGVLEDRSGARRYSVSSEMMSEISGRSDASPLIAVARRPNWSETAIRKEDDVLLVACDRPTLPGNVGTIVRCGDAMGASAIILVGHSADPYDPKAISASTGACFLTPVLELEGPNELSRLIAQIGQEGGVLTVYSADADGDVALSRADLRGPTALLLGSEREGLSQGMRALASASLRIAAGGHVDSLNLASAAAIMMYEVRRQRSDGESA